MTRLYHFKISLLTGSCLGEGKDMMLKTQRHIILAKTALLGWVNWAAGFLVGG